MQSPVSELAPRPQGPELLADLTTLVPDPNRLCVAYASLMQVQEGRTRQGRPYFDLVVSDAARTIAAKVWDDAPEAMEAARAARRGQAVKLLFRVEQYQGALQLNVRKLRGALDDDDGYAPARVFGEGFERVAGKLCRTLVFDIETAPAHDPATMPASVIEAIQRHATREACEPGLVMSLSPLFGQVVSLAFMDGDDLDGEVWALGVPPGGDPRRVVEAVPPWLQLVSERELLQAFWLLAAQAEVVVSYNGRNFDVPFLLGRSLVHEVPARVDLLGSPYALRPHLDLYRMIATGRSVAPAPLDAVCWALGVDSPKGGMSGADVAPAYARGELAAISSYNRGDVRATASVYQRVRDTVLRFREDW
ncbi:ribonuclease H-like domain-containing protein [Nannocystis bainbridge]|uniref:Ribonuclease H-like domain-containing protein n=1 Tax=Nannocystis bainbridge TaxID=2995303 RepID=A0ABT5EAW0_9BACT|nr:ribonuclease H-like domain-containing protein [Nannocystis bainbridge]MDC0723008.1 ribonuclease H-like domain-containing protein [Nannocystis bainbridge]